MVLKSFMAFTMVLKSFTLIFMMVSQMISRRVRQRATDEDNLHGNEPE
jgi:hypothetical protein